MEIQLKGRISELEQSIYEKAGESFNINSPKQLGVILFEKMTAAGWKKDKDRIFNRRRCSGKTGTGSIRLYRIFWNTGS